MKRFSKILISLILLSSMVLPFIPTIAKAQEEEEEIIFRIAADALPGDWDPAISDGYNVLSLYYFTVVSEYCCAGNALYDGGLSGIKKEEQWIPILCTSWETDWRDEEPNVSGFNNTGGRKSLTFKLREGVKFHDGSEWNATVFKWNIDRLYIITGNLTGDGDTRNEGTYWADVADYEPYFSESFNMSEYKGDSWYIIGNDTTYPGVTADANGVVKNPGYGPIDQYPMIREVQIIDKYTVKVIYNSWNTYGMPGGVWTRQISYTAYHKNYTNRGIYGYTNGVKDPKNPTIVDHLIGTGPYKYLTHSETSSPAGGYMIKNEDYWNKTALEEDGWFDIDKIEIVNFPVGQLGKDSKNTALLTHAVDYAFDAMDMPIDYDAVMANPNIDYIEDFPSDYITQITLNCINETWWVDPSVYVPSSWGLGTITYEEWRRGPYTSYPDTEPAGGIPRALRKAMSYAFNYERMIDIVLEGRAVRGGRVVGDGNIFYNESVPQTEYDLDYAREILLTTEADNYTKTPGAFNYNFSQRCAERGLTESSTDND
ncbi:MAG: ABC transporter substrate-binding protein, partial [Promethearchaeota archaeon]